MRPLVDGSMHIEAIYSLIKELHTKTYYNKMIQKKYEILEKIYA